MRKPLEIAPLTAEEVEALDKLYRTSKDVRLRTRAQIVLLAGEQRMTAPAKARDRARNGSNRAQLAQPLAFPKVLRDSKIVRCRVLHPKSRRNTSSSYVLWSDFGLGVWGNPARYGPLGVWPITWQSKQAFVCPMKPSVGCWLRLRLCSRAHSIRSVVLIQSIW
jgi:hypothetical protein